MKTPASLNLSAAPAALLPEKETTAIRTNFHSHTTRCNHATGRDEEYVQAAIAAGYRQLGISDHSPFPDHEGQVSGMRMHVTEFPDYLRSCQSLRENYAGEIEVFIGLEAEYYKPYHPWLLDLVQTHQLDYLILGSHYDDPIEDVYFGAIKSPRLLRRYTDHTIAGMRTGHFCALAHPELFMIGYPRFDADCKAASRDIIQAAIQLNLPLEYNLAGLYPTPPRASGKLPPRRAPPPSSAWTPTTPPAMPTQGSMTMPCSTSRTWASSASTAWCPAGRNSRRANTGRMN